MALHEIRDVAFGRASDVVRSAVRAETEGWDGIVVPGQSTLTSDPWVALALAARETDRLLLGTAVVGPERQTAPCMAGSATTVQQESNGRVMIGIGHGDSGAAFLGMGPQSVKAFERYLRRLQSLLRGEGVPFDLEMDGTVGFPTVESLHAGIAPQCVKLSMFLGGGKKVPLDVYATGPRVIKVAGTIAERVTFAVGAEPERVSWALDTPRAAMSDAGRTADEVSFGAFLLVFPHEDRALGRQHITGRVASVARFTAMQGAISTSVNDIDRSIYQGIYDNFTLANLYTTDSAQAEVLTDDFIDRFAVVGSAQECTDRLHELVQIGIERFVISFPIFGPTEGAFLLEGHIDPNSSDAKVVATARNSFVEEVMPDLRERTASRCAR